MSSFSSILSSMERQPKPPGTAAKSQRSATAPQRNGANGTRLKPNNAVAGVKRRSEEPEDDTRLKAAKTNGSTAAAPPGRFQLSNKSNAIQKPTGVPHRPSPVRTNSDTPQSPVTKPMPKIGSIPGAHASAPAVPVKRGFASIMERAKAAQNAAAASGPSTIRHKAAEKLTKRERRKLEEEVKAQEEAAKSTKQANVMGGGGGARPAGIQKGHEASYKGTMRKVAEPLSYKGTMRAADAGGKSNDKKQKAQAQDKYGGYASWSDLDDAEDDEEDGYDSEGSSDMEGGFDDVEREEITATRAARKEDQEALAEEERLKREKLERKRKLLELSKNAAARKKY